MRKILSYLSCFLFMAVAFMFGQAVKAGGDEYKVIFVGDSGVGKTSLVNAMRGYSFDEGNLPTVGAANAVIKVITENVGEVTLNIWDTAGQERFRSLVPLYVRGADVVVAVCSKNDQNSQNQILPWVETAMNVEQSLTANNIIVVQNKSDLPNGKSNNVNEDSFPDHHFIATSAKTGENIKKLLELISNVAVNYGQGTQPDDAMILEQWNDKQKKRCC